MIRGPSWASAHRAGESARGPEGAQALASPSLSSTTNGPSPRRAPPGVVLDHEWALAQGAGLAEMTITIALADADGGTELVAVHEGLPPGLSPTDNETGWRMALDKLAALAEGT
jgi:hypothetical protein